MKDFLKLSKYAMLVLSFFMFMACVSSSDDDGGSETVAVEITEIEVDGISKIEDGETYELTLDEVEELVLEFITESSDAEGFLEVDGIVEAEDDKGPKFKFNFDDFASKAFEEGKTYEITVEIIDGSEKVKFEFNIEIKEEASQSSEEESSSSEEESSSSEEESSSSEEESSSSEEESSSSEEESSSSEEESSSSEEESSSSEEESSSSEDESSSSDEEPSSSSEDESSSSDEEPGEFEVDYEGGDAGANAGPLSDDKKAVFVWSNGEATSEFDFWCSGSCAHVSNGLDTANQSFPMDFYYGETSAYNFAWDDSHAPGDDASTYSIDFTGYTHIYINAEIANTPGIIEIGIIWGIEPTGWDSNGYPYWDVDPDTDVDKTGLGGSVWKSFGPGTHDRNISIADEWVHQDGLDKYEIDVSKIKQINIRIPNSLDEDDVPQALFTLKELSFQK